MQGKADPSEEAGRLLAEGHPGQGELCRDLHPGRPAQGPDRHPAPQQPHRVGPQGQQGRPQLRPQEV